MAEEEEVEAASEVVLEAEAEACLEEVGVAWEEEEASAEDMAKDSRQGMNSQGEHPRRTWLDDSMSVSREELWTPAGTTWKADSGVSRTSARGSTKTSGEMSLLIQVGL
jgi:hypothetical protein